VRRWTWWAGAMVAAVVVPALGVVPISHASGATGAVRVVAAENQYGNVAAQIGGRYVSVTSIESNPNTDPHDYEVSPRIAGQVAGAQLVIQNGLGYDSFMNRLEASAPAGGRKVVDVQHLLGLPDSTSNPHVWYDPKTMPLVAAAIGAQLSAIDPAHATTYAANVARFDASLVPWTDLIAAFRAQHPGTLVATTEPVANDLLDAMGVVNRTPFSFQSAVMNGTDPSPQDIAQVRALFPAHAVGALVYNSQVTDAVTQSIRAAAQHAGVPVVGVSETMPATSNYQSWMLRETRAIQAAVLRP
jgi:zinc/manganese transport system substrate-binding protein